jgi:hypothetical protein
MKTKMKKEGKYYEKNTLSLSLSPIIITLIIMFLAEKDFTINV